MRAILAIIAIMIGTHSVASSRLDEAYDLLNKLNATVSSDVEASTKELEQSLVEIDDLYENQMKMAKKTIDEDMTSINEVIAHLYEQAAKEGVDNITLDRCTKTFDEALTILPQILLNDIDGCINDTTKLGKDMIEKYITELAHAEEITERLLLNIDICALEEDQDTCLDPVITEISEDMVTMPARIKEDTDTAKAVKVSVEKLTLGCLTDRQSSVLAMGQEIISGIKVCAKLS